MREPEARRKNADTKQIERDGSNAVARYEEKKTAKGERAAESETEGARDSAGPGEALLSRRATARAA